MPVCACAQEAANQFGFADALGALHETCTENRSDYPAHAVVREELRDFHSPPSVYPRADRGIDIAEVHLGTVRIPYSRSCIHVRAS